MSRPRLLITLLATYDCIADRIMNLQAYNIHWGCQSFCRSKPWHGIAGFSALESHQVPIQLMVRATDTLEAQARQDLSNSPSCWQNSWF